MGGTWDLKRIYVSHRREAVIDAPDGTLGSEGYRIESESLFGCTETYPRVDP